MNERPMRVGDRVEVRLMAGWTPGVVRAIVSAFFYGDGRVTRFNVETDDGTLYRACHPDCVRPASSLEDAA